MLLNIKQKKSIFLNLLLISIIGVIALFFLVSTFPPHLPQEIDFLNYHGTLPKQHDLHGFWWRHLSWSSADLWPQTIQWILWPFWKLFPPGHRIPQFILAIGAWILSIRILELRGHGKKEAALFLTFLFFSHGFLIQWGIAMLDLPMLFFWALFLFGLLSKRHWLSGLGSGVIIGSKSFNLFLFAAAIFPFIFLYWKDILNNQRKIVLPVILCSAIVLPFYIRTFIYTGTPVFPILPCTINIGYCSEPEERKIIMDSSEAQVGTLDYYGNGRSLLAAFKAMVFLPFPEKNSVNNKYDYPLGFAWWITLLILVYQFLNWKKSDRWTKSCAVSASLLLILWFLGSQQSRWLFVPMLISFLSIQSDENPFQHRHFPLAGIIILLMIFLSVLMIKNSHPYIFSKDRIGVLNEKYRKDIEIRTGKIQTIDYRERNDIFYINAPVEMKTGGIYWILPLTGEK